MLKNFDGCLAKPTTQFEHELTNKHLTHPKRTL